MSAWILVPSPRSEHQKKFRPEMSAELSKTFVGAVWHQIFNDEGAVVRCHLGVTETQARATIKLVNYGQRKYAHSWDTASEFHVLYFLRVSTLRVWTNRWTAKGSLQSTNVLGTFIDRQDLGAQDRMDLHTRISRYSQLGLNWIMSSGIWRDLKDSGAGRKYESSGGRILLLLLSRYAVSWTSQSTSWSETTDNLWQSDWLHSSNVEHMNAFI